jgi:hypothetical protein
MVHRNHADLRSFVTLGSVLSIIEREPEVVEAPEQPPVEAAPEPAPERPCAECGAPLQPDQDWCLECGTAQPDRPGARPGWRTAAAVLATTGVLASGAVAAAYAGLSADARKAAAPNAQAALPAQPPAQVTPPPAATPPAATTPPPTPPKSTTPPAAKTPAPTPPASTATPPAAKTTTPSTSTTTTKKPTTTPSDTTTTKSPSPGPLAAIKLDPEAAQTYNPYARPATDFTDAKLTLDGDQATAWTASFNGADALLGVVLDLGKSKGVRALQLVTTTPGMTVEVYGARGAQPPVSVQDPKWDHVATQLDVAKDGRIRLGDGSDKYRWVLVWPTEGPPDGSTQVAISELKAYQ